MPTKLRRFADRLALFFREHRNLNLTATQAEIRALRNEMRIATPDNPALAGYRVYSQFDEDGILAEIFRRLKLARGTFLEVGCGYGLENNTHLLLLRGWSGTWVDGSSRNVGIIRDALPVNEARLKVREMMVDRDNVRELGAPVDFLSMDVDGNDLHLLDRLVPLCQPKVICAEYNALFPPPIALAMPYNAQHGWSAGGDSYFGASLQALVELLSTHRLVACGLSGANAFFVREDLAGPFERYEVAELYQPPRYHLLEGRDSHRQSFKWLADELRKDRESSSA